MTEDRSRGVFLTDKQLVFVFMAATVVLVVVFLCGILVGRGVQTYRGMTPDGTMISTAQVVPDVDARPVSPAGPAAGAPPADSGGETLTYSTSLTEEARPVEQLAPPAAGPPPAIPPAVPDPPVASSASDEAAPWVVQVTAVRSRTEADSIADRLKRKGYEAFVFVPDGTDQLGVFRVRVGPFVTRRDAEAVARRLEREEKYKPWITR